MKKITPILIMLSVIVLTACSKNHVCSCKKTVTINGEIGEYPEENSVINNKSTSDAVELCNEGDTQNTQGNETITVNCELK